MFDIERVKKEIETDFKYCTTKDEFVTFHNICYGYVFGLVNFWTKDRAWETECSKELAEWWENEMLPKFNEEIKNRG